MPNKHEIWKPVKGFDGYEVSNLGNVRSLDRTIYWIRNGKKVASHIKGRNLVPVIRRGYKICKLTGGKYALIHRLVAKAFIPNPDNLPCINHKDENKGNNVWTNLEWCTVQYNNTYGTARERARAKNKGRKRSPEFRRRLSILATGRRWSPESKAKMSEARRGCYNTKLSKPVQALNPETGEVVHEFPSASEAGRNGYTQSNVSACCRGGYGYKTYKGFIWRYKQ